MFTGSATVTTVSKSLARITGLSLASGASGTISLAEGSGDVKLNADIQWSPFAGDDEGDDVVDLEEACQVSTVCTTDPGETSGKVGITKTGGTDPAAFLITLENYEGGESVTGDLEIYIRFH